MTRCDSRAPRAISAKFAIALLTGLCVLSLMPGSLQAQAAADSQQLTYQLNETWIEGGVGSMTVLVHQAGDVAVARHESGSIAMVSNPTAGIVSAGTTRLAWSNLPFLIEMVEVPESLGPGSEMPTGDDWVHVIESISFNLERGDSDRILEGHHAEHRVLTIDLKLRQVGPDGRSNSELATGRADLWTAPDLPFSWLPYTSPTGYMWALPLSFNYRQVAAHVLAELSDELLGLGLLLRSEVRGSIVIGDSGSRMEQEYIREVSVEGLETTAGPLDMTPFDQPVLTMSRVKALMGGMMIAESCTREVPAGASSLTLKTNKTREISGEGVARVDPEAGMEGATILVLGSLSTDPSSTEQGPGCITIITEPTGPEPGEYPLAVGVDGWETTPTPKATAYYFRGNEESFQLTLIDTGTLIVESAGPGKLQAKLHGTGWTADLTPSSPALIEDVAVELFFELDAPDTEVSLADAAAAPVDVEPWSPLTFNPALDKPVAEWAFGGAGVSRAALDSRGRYAAVALSSEPKIVLLDLDSRSQLGEIDVNRDSGGKHVSSLAFGPSGNRLAIGLPMGRVRIVDTRTRETLHELQYSKGGASTPVMSLKFDPAGDRVLGFTLRAVVAWDTESGEVLSTWEAGSVKDLAFTPDGTRVAMLVSMESVKIWDSQTASEICALPGDFSGLTMHPAGDRIAAWSFENKVVVASTSDCSEIATWPAAPTFVPAIAWAADGRHLILGSGDGPLHVYTEQGELAGVWSGHASGSFVLTSSGSNRVLSTGLSQESKAILWEANKP